MKTAVRRLPTPRAPSPRETDLARGGLRLLEACLDGGKAVRLQVIDDGQEITVPVSALRMLVDILARMARGNAVTVVPYNAELTTQGAADFLPVSRPPVVALLERGELSYRMVGTHRRIPFSDLVRYRELSLVRSRKALDGPAQQAQELGLGYGTAR